MPEHELTAVTMKRVQPLSEAELEDIIGYEANFTGANYKPTATFRMAMEIRDLRLRNADRDREIERLREALEALVAEQNRVVTSPQMALGDAS